MSIHRLKNGVTVVLCPSREPTTAVVGVLNAGSRHDPKDVPGLHHALEHLMGRATKRFPSWEALTTEVERYCTEWNAETDKQTVSFYFESNRHKIRSTIGLLEQMIRYPLITQDDVRAEHGRLSEERRLANDLVEEWVAEEYDRLTLKAGLEHSVDGPVPVIRHYTAHRLQQLYDRLVVGKRLTIVVCGGFDRQAVLRTIKRRFADLPVGRSARPHRAPQLHRRSLIRLRNLPGYEQVQYMVGFSTSGWSSPDRYALHVLHDLLSNRSSSRIRIAVDSRGLVYSSGSFLDFFPDVGQYGVQGELAPAKLLPALSIIAAEFNRVRTTLVTERELTQAKEHVRLMTRKYFADPLCAAMFRGRQIAVFGRFVPTAEFLRGIDGVTRQRLRQVARRTLTQRRLYIVAAGPLQGIKKHHVRDALRYRRTP